MPQDQQHNTDSPLRFDVDLRVLALNIERASCLADLLQDAHQDLRPVGFAERHLVDEMAFNKWRLLRVHGMEKAVYDHRLARFRPKPDGAVPEPHKDLYDQILALSPENDGVILAALGRLEARFHRQFCSALRMLMALRRFQHLTSNTEKAKGPNECQPTPSEPSSATATTPSPNNSSPSSNP